MSNCQCTAAYYCPDENQYEPGHTCEECKQQEFVNNHLVDENINNNRMPLAPLLIELEPDGLPF